MAGFLLRPMENMVANEMDAITKLMKDVAEIGRGNKEYLDAVAGVLGCVIGIMIDADVTTREAVVERIERISTAAPLRQKMMLAIVQAAVSNRTQ